MFIPFLYFYKLWILKRRNPPNFAILRHIFFAGIKIFCIYSGNIQGIYLLKVCRDPGLVVGLSERGNIVSPIFQFGSCYDVWIFCLRIFDLLWSCPFSLRCFFLFSSSISSVRISWFFFEFWLQVTTVGLPHFQTIKVVNPRPCPSPDDVRDDGVFFLSSSDASRFSLFQVTKAESPHPRGS